MTQKANGFTATVDGMPVFIEFPPGWEEYDETQKTDWLAHQRHRLGVERKKAALLQRRMEQERFTAPPIEITPAPYEVTPGSPKHVIRALFGACAGTVFSRILILPYEERYLQRRTGPLGVAPREKRSTRPPALEDVEFHEGVFEGVIKAKEDVIASWADGRFFDSVPVLGGLTEGGTHAPVWGPREFLWNILKAAGQVHGDAAVFVVHSGQQFNIDAVEFRAWVERGVQDPRTALYMPPEPKV